MVKGFTALQINAFLVRFRPYQLVEWKADYLKAMDRLGKGLDKLQAAKESSAFQAEVARTILPLGIRLMAVEVKSRSSKATWKRCREGGAKETAMVVVKGDHFGDEPSILKMTKAFRDVANEKNAPFNGPTRVEGNVVYMVGGVSDAKVSPARSTRNK